VHATLESTNAKSTKAVRMGRLIRGHRTSPSAATSDTAAPRSALASGREAGGRLTSEEKHRLETEARRKGFEIGHAEGRRHAEAECTTVLLAARTEAAALLADARKAAVPLAVRMAERIVGHEVARDPAVLLDILAQAVRASGVTAGPVQIRIHPEDAKVVEAQRPQLAAKLGASVLVRWVLDETIGRAGCIVETSRMRLDARLETQLDVLAQALLGASPVKQTGGS